MAMGQNHQHQQHLDQSLLEGCASMLDLIDKKVLVLLRDKKSLIGMLRTCDQFNNLVLQDAVERINVGLEYADVQRGVFLVRGDTVVMVGEIDYQREKDSKLVEVPMAKILALQRLEQEARAKKEELRNKAFKERGRQPPGDSGAGGDEF